MLQAQLDEANRRNGSLQRALEQASETVHDLESASQGGEPASEVTAGQDTESKPASPPSRLTELEPVVDQGLWSVEPASIGGNDFGDAITIGTEWGDASGRSWAEYAVNDVLGHLLGRHRDPGRRAQL